MHSRWDDAAARDLSDFDLLVYASRLVGAEASLVVWGGGNTSIKRVERDHRGREVRVLRVKGSGGPQEHPEEGLSRRQASATAGVSSKFSAR